MNEFVYKAPTEIELIAIHAQARAMRAQMIRQMFVSAYRGVRSLFASDCGKVASAN